MARDTALPQTVLETLQGFTGPEPMKRLFWSTLNYNRINDELPMTGWGSAAADPLHEPPLLLAGAGEGDEFRVIYTRLKSDKLLLGEERPVITRLLRDHPYALFLVSNKQQDRWHFVNVKYDDDVARRRVFRRITIGRDERLRTAAERIAGLDAATTGASPLVIQQLHDVAFDVERVTDEFFVKYREVFEGVEAGVQGIRDKARKRLFVQRLFNRLMFIAFVQKKGWLRFGTERDYLAALWKSYYRERSDSGNFYIGRLKLLFFSGLNNSQEHDQMRINRGGLLGKLIGEVPYLNGGLFEQEDDDRDDAIGVPDESIRAILLDLFGRFNFTVTESTPLDIEVAVDPEMLGRVFEELVTGRHESGSYYTPKPVVSFMCREALKGHLGTLAEEKPAAVEKFIEDRDPAGLRNSEAVLEALRRVRVVDPACGSGAYLLGMLHELLELRQALFAANQLDPKTTYNRKLEIIQSNLYGVDLDEFAVNIARLRLWLSLAVDYDGDKPEHLPNLDFKVEVGDSLTARRPEIVGQMAMQDALVRDYQGVKDKYLMSHGNRKTALKAEALHLKEQVAIFTRTKHAPQGFDWPVEFAEVFCPGRTAESPAGGFDIVLANPPYVRADPQFRHIEDERRRQEEIARYKVYRTKLVESGIYETLYEKWDLYIPFLERAHQLLGPDGQMVYIIPDAYNAAKYAKKSHEFFLSRSRVERVDFCTDIPLFNAGVSNTILHFARAMPTESHTPVRVRRWGKKADEFELNAELLPTASQPKLGPALFRPDGSAATETRPGFVPLGYICYVSWGLRPCSDERTARGAFTKNQLLVDRADSKHPKPFVEGKGMVRWWIVRTRFLEWGTPRAPAQFARPTFPELYAVPEKLLGMDITGVQLRAAYDNEQKLCNNSISCCVPWHSLSGVRNRSIRKTASHKNETSRYDAGSLLCREELEEVSRKFNPKFILAMMNSSVASKLLAQKRRSRYHVYPDDWKNLPIPDIPPAKQKPIVKLVDAILAEFKQHGYPLPPESAARVAELEREVDERVQGLYEQGAEKDEDRESGSAE
jgi:hypothetical protein